MRLIALIALLLALVVACEIPTATDSVNASEAEKRSACRQLRLFNYDYWLIEGPGRVLEVAAAIHLDHPGPEATKKYCAKYL